MNHTDASASAKSAAYAITRFHHGHDDRRIASAGAGDVASVEFVFMERWIGWSARGLFPLHAWASSLHEAMAR